MKEKIGAVRGLVTLLEHTDGVETRRITVENAYTLLGAFDHARIISGELNPPSLVPLEIGLGVGGTTLSECESDSGWTDTPVVDGVTYRQGYGSLKRSVSASGTAMPRHATLVSAFAATGDLEIFMRLDYRGRCDLTASKLRVFTGGVDTTYFEISFAGIETVMGPFVDGTWVKARIPKASFSTGAGTPSWSFVTGFGLVVVANAVGALTVWWDDCRSLATIDVSSAATLVPTERTVQTITDVGRVDSTVTATAFWGSGEGVGHWYVAGLYSNGGTTLASIVALDYYKAAGVTLTINWALTPQGG
jgi:hypothetical protein